MEKLHPGSKWLFRFRVYSSFIYIGIIIFVYGFQILTSFTGDLMWISFIFPIFFVIFIAEIYANMYYDRYLYEITKDAVKIEKGIIWKKYISIPYKKVQNINIKRGIFARILGFSSVEIETAGQSGYSRRGNRVYQSEGYLPSIEVKDAEKIREFIMEKIRQTHDSGL